MSRYRKIEVRTWSDEAFRELTPLQPSGQALWFYLLTGPQTGPIPGLYRAGRAAMAEELDWPLDDFYEKFGELEARGMARADWKARLVWLPNALKHNKPESPNVVKSWRVELDLLPECALKREALAQMRQAIADMGPSYLDAFEEALAGAEPKTTPKPAAKPSPQPSAKPSPEALPEAFPEPFWKGLPESGTGTGTETGNPTPAAPAPTNPAPAAEPPGAVGVVSAALLSTAMRKFGINANPGHPQLVALAAQGVTTDAVTAACEEAKRTKPDEAIGMGYVVGILKRWKAEADALDLAGATAPKTGGAWKVNDQATEAKGRELGLTPRPGERMDDFKGRIQAKLDNPNKPPPSPIRIIAPAAVEPRSRMPEGLDLKSFLRKAMPVTP